MRNRTVKAVIAAMASIIIVGYNNITARGQETDIKDNIDSISCISDGRDCEEKSVNKILL